MFSFIMRAMSEAAIRQNPGRPSIEARIDAIAMAATTLAAFAIYWTSSFSLEIRNATTYFGADSWHFTELAFGHFNDRIIRLHPVTVVLSLGWMKLLSPLTAWIAPIALLKAMFALIGALGVLAAVHAFSAFMPRRYALLWAAIYGASMGIWYFSSIEESKIVSATLAATYIALYVILRENRTPRGMVILTGVLLIACLNEITAAFLVAIPAIDTLLRNKFDLRALRWVFLHALAAPLALLILEFGIRKFVVISPEHKEGSNLVEIFIWYASQNTFSLKTIFDFLQRWFLFNIAAPEPEINYAVAKLRYGGDFEPALAHYFRSPFSALMIAAFAAMMFCAVLFRTQDPKSAPLGGIMLALCAYALLRMIFFFFFIPGECLLYSPSISLAHLLLVAIPFMASRFPYKGTLAALAAVALFATNAAFIFTAQAIPYGQ